MYCPKCGTLNDQRAFNCSRCGASLNAAEPLPDTLRQSDVSPQYPPYSAVPGHPPQNIPSYMVQSILATLFCCLPLGIVGIIKANKITKMLAQNDIVGASTASAENKKTLWIAFGVGIVVNVIYVLVQMNK